jgi:hypothetical protein
MRYAVSCALRRFVLASCGVSMTSRLGVTWQLSLVPESRRLVEAVKVEIDATDDRTENGSLYYVQPVGWSHYGDDSWFVLL